VKRHHYFMASISKVSQEFQYFETSVRITVVVGLDKNTELSTGKRDVARWQGLRAREVLLHKNKKFLMLRARTVFSAGILGQRNGS